MTWFISTPFLLGYAYVLGALTPIAILRLRRRPPGGPMPQRVANLIAEHFRWFVVLVVVGTVILPATAVGLLGVEYLHLHRSDQAQHTRSDCQQRVFAQTITALRSRSSFSEQQALVALQLSIAQRTFLSTPPSATDPQKRRAFEDYLQALGFSISSTRDELKVRRADPFPTVEQVNAC